MKRCLQTFPVCFSEFEKECLDHHFTRRGQAFFRVIGDGVIQTLKYEYERAGSYYELRMGLLSMYGELQKQWLTSSGCIPRYPVMCLCEGKYEHRTEILNDAGKWKGPCWLRNVNPVEQLSVLRSKGFSFLDKVDTQVQLANALCYLDGNCYNGTIIWNDLIKFAPFLYADERAKAIKVIDSILNQHRFALERYKETLTPQKLNDRFVSLENKDNELMLKRELITDAKSAHEYLHNNFQQNLLYTKFCIK